MRQAQDLASFSALQITRRRTPPYRASGLVLGRGAPLQGSIREGPESAPKPSFHCERETAFTAHAEDLHGPDISEKGPVPLGYALEFIERNLRRSKKVHVAHELNLRPVWKLPLEYRPRCYRRLHIKTAIVSPAFNRRTSLHPAGFWRQIRRRFGSWRAGHRSKLLPNCAGPTLEQQMGSSTLCVAFAFLRYPRVQAFRADRRRRLRRSRRRGQRARSAGSLPQALIGVQSDVRVVHGRRPRGQRRRPLRDASPSAPCSS